MFHVPFERRDIISSQRYSIPGCPALYFSDSFFTCWCELDKPNLNTISFAKFRYTTTPIFLDLSYTYRFREKWETYALLAMYPLLLSCMVRVNNQNAYFKPEYIMPQLMMKLVRDQYTSFNGIVYMSNKIPESCDIHSMSSRNYVICVRNLICKSGYDKNLAKDLQITKIHTLTTQELKSAISFDNNIYSINFKKIENFTKDFHDIVVPMNLG